MDHTNYEADRSSKTVNIGSHIPDVIGTLPQETKVRIINNPELVGKCNAGQEDKIQCITEYGGQEAYYLYKAIGIFLRSDLEVIDA